jgi:hypothetical protein
MATARPYFLWTVRHNSASSVREGCGRHRASGVNLLTFDAISPRKPRFAVRMAVIVVFWQRKKRIQVCKTTLVRQNRSMRNPDKWLPKEPDEPEVPEPPGGDGSGGDGEPDSSGTRRGALVGLIVVVLLVVGGLVLTHVLRGLSQVQDCALSGRSNCT